MGLNCGIVGLPNVGKSTLFQALTAAPAEAANYPFCTIDPNVGIVHVNDLRLEKISQYIRTQKIVPAVVEFVDIAGLVKGASKGEGLGNKFLGHVREVNALVHVVRCFDDSDIVHINGKIDPVDDIGVIDTELVLADLETVERRLETIPKQIKNQNKQISSQAKALMPLLEKVKNHLERGRTVRSFKWDENEAKELESFNLITSKKIIYACNVEESESDGKNPYVEEVRKLVGDSDVIVVCGKLESEISALQTLEEQKEFMEIANIAERGLDKLIQTAYNSLGLKTYFTAGEKEVRAWTFKVGAKAPEAAGIIHSDFERGFIKAEVYHCDELFELKSEQKIREAGKVRMEGKNYAVCDGDIINFKFNV